MFGLGFRLRPATPGWGVGVCVCSCACHACTLPLLAGVCGVGMCVWARVSAAPRDSWLGCWGVFVLVCVLLLYPASCGWGVRLECVCLGSGFSCTPPLHAGLCVLRLHPATPGWDARCGCVCLGSGFGCAPPLLAGVLGCVCARVGAPLAPRHSWVGCAVCVCVFGLAFRLRPATPGWGVGVCVFVCLLPLYPANTGRVARRGCVCFGSGFGCAPPLLAGVLGCACL